MPIVTRLYTPTEIGIAALFLSFFMFWAATLSLRYEYALLIAEDDAESHVVQRLAISIVVLMSILGVPALWALQRTNILKFGLLPNWAPLIAFPILLGHGVYMVYRSWALRGNLIPCITGTSIARAVANSGTKLALGALCASVGSLLAAELAGASVSMLKLMRATRNYFSISRPGRIGLSQITSVGRKFAKFPLLETPSAWVDLLTFVLPLPLVTSLYGAEAAGWFGLARVVVSIPNAQIGAAVADVFQMELAKSVLQKDRLRARQLFYALFKKMALLGLMPALGMAAVLPFAFPLVFGQQWQPGGIIAACLTPWFYTSFIVAPLNRVLSVLQVQEWKLMCDILGVGLLLGGFMVAKTHGFDLIDFCILLSLVSVIHHTIYATVLIRVVENKLPIPKCSGDH